VSDWIDGLALLCTAAGLGVGLLVLVAGRDPLVALKVALEFWTAAGLLRLSGPADWEHLGGAAAIVAMRQLLGLSLRTSPRGRGPVRLHQALAPAWFRRRH